jgi:glutathione reductase (NADPH)
MPKTETTYDYDLFVIGAGSGGMRASRVSAAYGAKVAVAEEYRVGGTCVIRGCVPKKLLVYGSHFAEELQDAAHYGWTVEGMKFDWGTLRDTVLRDVDRLNGLYEQTLENNNVERFMERATITGPNSVKLAGGRECRNSKGSSTASPRTRCFICRSCRGASRSRARDISRWSSPASSTRLAAT